jgi:hypothetical protein
LAVFGVNYQFSNIVLGAEGDFDWTSLDATGNGRFVPGVGTLQGLANTRWILTALRREFCAECWGLPAKAE